MPRTSPFRATAAHHHLLQALHAGDDEAVAPAARCSSTRRRGIFFCCSNTASSVAPVSMRKVSTCNWPCADAQRVPFGSAGVSWWRAGRAGRRARRSPDPRRAASRPRCFRGSTAAASALRSSGLITPVTGFLCRRLVGLHGLDQPLAEFAVDRPGEVAAPGEIVLDRHAVGLRDRRIGVLQARRLAARCRRRRCRWSRILDFGFAAAASSFLSGIRLRLGGFGFFRADFGFGSGFAALAARVASGAGIGPRIALRERRRASQNHGQNRSGNAHTNPDTAGAAP